MEKRTDYNNESEAVLFFTYPQQTHTHTLKTGPQWSCSPRNWPWHPASAPTGSRRNPQEPGPIGEFLNLVKKGGLGGRKGKSRKFPANSWN